MAIIPPGQDRVNKYGHRRYDHNGGQRRIKISIRRRFIEPATLPVSFLALGQWICRSVIVGNCHLFLFLLFHKCSGFFPRYRGMARPKQTIATTTRITSMTCFCIKAINLPTFTAFSLLKLLPFPSPFVLLDHLLWGDQLHSYRRE